MLRPAQDAEIDQLESRSISAGGDRRVFLREQDGVSVGAAVVLDKPFESGILKRRVMQIDAIEAWERTNNLETLAVETLETLAKDGVDLVVCRRPESDRQTLAALQRAGMCVVECLMTLSHPLKDVPAAEADIAARDETDAAGCASVGARAFRFDRFHADPLVDDAAADALKGTWARNAVLGRADRVFVTRERDRITGFNACLLRDGNAIIDLIGVDPDFQGRGLGRRLVNAALAHYSGRAARLAVGTQSANHVSLALYQRAGFSVEHSALTLHAHLS